MGVGGDQSISMKPISKQTYISACISNQIVYSDESNYKDICKELRSNTDTNFVLITHCEHDNIIEPINLPRNITKWFVSDLSLEHSKKESIPTGIETTQFGLQLPSVLYENYLGIFDNANHILDIVNKSVICSSIEKRFTSSNSYPFLLEFMISTTEREVYITLLGGGIPIVTNKKFFDIYHDAPILLIKKWEDINKSLLHQTKAIFKNKLFQMNTLTPQYWRQKIWKAAGH